MSYNTNQQQPPAIPVHIGPGTPSTEWASQTTLAVDNAAEATKGNASPNQGSIPGAFPGSITQQDHDEFAQGAKETLEHAQRQAQKTAQDALAGAEQVAQSVYTNAEQAARQYLPTGVVNKLEQVGVISGDTTNTNTNIEQKIAEYDASHSDPRPGDATSLPSHETGPFHPTHGGVGTLPGGPNESGVAKLPEERLQELRSELPTHDHGPFKPTHGGVGSLPGDENETGVAELPDERNKRERERTRELNELREELPTHEQGSFAPTHGGVGSLPGDKDESGVAVLPEERASQQGMAQTHSASQANTSNQFTPSALGTRDATSLGSDTLSSKRAVPPVPKDKQYGLGAEGPAAVAQASQANTSNQFPPSALGTRDATSLGSDTLNSKRAVPPVPKDKQYGLGAEGPAAVAQASQANTSHQFPPSALGTHDATSVGSDTLNSKRAVPPVPKDRQYGLGAQGPAAVAQGDGHGAPPPSSSDQLKGRPGYVEQQHGDQSSGKVGFGTKLKAEAKILSGKIRNDEERIMEGKAMKQGE